MILSKQKLLQEAVNTGFRAEILEKVFLLMTLLTELADHSQLKNKLALKGGTALNLFYFNLPRLSVDIDLNYIGAIDRDTMLEDREIIHTTITAICQRQGFSLDRNPKMHAGGKMIWRYPSAIGQMGNLEIDLNFMHRVPLWPIEYKKSCMVGSSTVDQIPILDVHEVAAGKLTALLDRQTGRDLFDAHHLLTKLDLDHKKMRIALVVYAGISRKKDWRKLTPMDINFDIDELSRRLVPLLTKSELTGISSITTWAENLVNQCRAKFSAFLPFKENEVEFLNRLLDYAEIKPELICDDAQLIEKIQSHPALKWSVQVASKTVA